MTDYEKLYDFQNLYTAHLKARKCRRYKPEVLQFELALSENLAEMSKALRERRYRLSGYYHFTIHEPKEREVYAAYYPDKVLLHCLCDQVLMPRISPRLIYDNAACQVGKGTHFALDRLTYFLRSYHRLYGNTGYVLKCDIDKYFSNIDHVVLKEKLCRILHDSDILHLTDALIDSYETPGRAGKGLPLGNQSSQCFAIYYLDALDRLIKERLHIRFYTRYMDDFILIHPDKSYLQHCLAEIQHLLEEELHLKLNPKTGISPLKDGIEYLGWRFYLCCSGKVIRRLRKQSKKRFLRRIAKLKKDYSSGKMGLDEINACLASYHGYLKHGDTYQFRQKAFQNFVLVRNSR